METMSETRFFIDWDYEEDQVLHLFRPRVKPGALLIEIRSKSRWIKYLVSLVVSINEAPALTPNLN
jgi:hypothetical protein